MLKLMRQSCGSLISNLHRKMLAKARLNGYLITTPSVVAITTA